jgi:hypothetical protein
MSMVRDDRCQDSDVRMDFEGRDLDTINRLHAMGIYGWVPRF